VTNIGNSETFQLTIQIFNTFAIYIFT